MAKKMTYCKDCGAEVSKSAKTCPKCGAKLKKAHPIGIIIGIIIVIIGICTIINSGSSNKTSTNLTTSTENAQSEQYMTLEKFNKIQTGMTYQQVVDIVGTEGTLSTESSYGSASMKIYYWYSSDGVSNATISFDNDKVSAKSQIGLK